LSAREDLENVSAMKNNIVGEFVATGALLLERFSRESLYSESLLWESLLFESVLGGRQGRGRKWNEVLIE
jgi:hypothetical protein